MTVGCESGLGGTVGNSLVGLKAIPISGQNRNLTFFQSFKRHIMDPVDMFLFGLVGIIIIKNTDKNLHQLLLFSKNFRLRRAFIIIFLSKVKFGVPEVDF